MAPAEWTRQEQQLLQAALRQNPPSMENTARWEAIAAAVPGRGPQECLDQCRVLAAAVKGASSADEAKARFKLAKQNAEDARVAAVANRERAAQERAARAAREQEEAAAAKARASDRGPRWWTRALASEVDPISLEPLRSLHYPPYECRADTSVTHQTGSDWFDGVTLAAYLVSTGGFQHPISRRELTREDCVSLDKYLVAHGHGEARVEHAYDHRLGLVRARVRVS